MSSSSVEKIKERLSIVDVVSSYISLIQAGRNYKAKCPFHNEKTPSFFLSPERGSYYCFGCGAKGDIFSFVEHFEGTDFLGALKLLAEKAGVPLEKNFSKGIKNDKDKLYEIMEEATVFFEKRLNQKKETQEYLKSRGVSNKIIKIFRIGYAPDSWQSVSTHLIEKGFRKDDLVKVGLIKSKEGGNFYDRFRNRIIFPINDSSGRVIAFSGRIFNKDNDKEAKYLNSPETPLFNKSNTLFGIDKAKVSIRKRNYSIIVEGQFDLILSHQAGFTNTVAVSGTALSDKISEKYNDSSEVNKIKINNLGLIQRLSSNVIFAFDGDEAGIRAANRSSLIALSLGMQVKIAVIPGGKDPADIIQKEIKDWKNIIKNSVNIIDFHLNIICKNTNDIRLRGKKIREIIFPFVSAVSSSIEKFAYISLIHKKTGISENVINEDLENYEKAESSNKSNVDINKNTNENIKSRRDRLEERLLGIILWKPEIKSDKLNKEDNQLNKIDEIINNFEKNINKGYIDKIKEKYKSDFSILAFEAELWYGDKTNEIFKDLKEITLNLEEEILKEKKQYLNTEIYKKETSSNKKEADSLLKDIQKVDKRIEEIKYLRKDDI